MKEDEKERNDHKPGGIGIPGEVAYNYCLSQTEKLMFGFLQNLSRTKNGYWGSNAYLGRVVGNLGKQVISNSLKKLEDCGYTIMKYKKIKGGITRRNIFIDPNYKVKYQELVSLYYSVIDDDEEEENPINTIIKYTNPLIPPRYRIYTKKNIQKNTLNKDSLFHKESLIKSSHEDLIPIKRSPRLYNKRKIDDVADDIEKEQRQHLKKKKRKRVRDVVMPESIKSIIEHWNSLPGLRRMKYNTKLHQQTVDSLKKLIRGTYFEEDVFKRDAFIKKYIGKKFDCELIKQVISDFSLVVDNAHYTPRESLRRWYKKQALNDFVFNIRANESLFLKFYVNKPKPFTIPAVKLPDNYPTQTLALKNLYVKNVLGGEWKYE